MSLRNQLATKLAVEGQKLRVASPIACNMQLQQFCMQPLVQPACNASRHEPGESSGLSATGDATAVQEPSCIHTPLADGGCNRVAQLHSLDGATRNYGPLTEHRLGSDLAAAISRACGLRGDDEANRAALLTECLALPMSGRLDMLAHFESVAALWSRVTEGAHGK